MPALLHLAKQLTQTLEALFGELGEALEAAQLF